MSGITVPPHGPLSARILIVGEHPTVDDERKMRLFTGNTGEEFHKMLHEAGLISSEIRFTTLLRSRPFASQIKYEWTKVSKEAKECMPGVKKTPDGVWASDTFKQSAFDLLREIESLKPNLVIALGDAVLWALTGETSVSKWRGSLLKVRNTEIKLIPTYTPAQIMRMWEWRAYTVRDLQRAKEQGEFAETRAPEIRLITRLTYHATMAWIRTTIAVAARSDTPTYIVSDIETISRHIACIGIATSKREAICIPFMNAKQTHYFTLEEEHEIIWQLRQLFLHPNVRIIGQNFSYDTQHIVRSWGFRPETHFDTMLAQHVCFPGIPKDLGFLASMYCEHYVYWKDELTDYRTLPADLDKFWLYNAKDCVNTFEIFEVLEQLITKLGFREQFDFIMKLNRHVNSMMLRGVNIDQKVKSDYASMLIFELELRQHEINHLVSGELNISSPKQMKELFYDQLGMKTVAHKKTHEPTTDKDAMKIFGIREPILQPLTSLIEETRSIGVFLSTFVQMPLDKDKRMRCSYNAGGTETFRFSSSKNAFGSGGNLQNIPKGNEDEEDNTGFVFPNLRRMFIPDRGFVLFDVDLAGADAQVVAWEAEDDDLKAKFRSGAKIHALNAKDIYGRDAGPDGKRMPYYKMAKMGTHLSNYGGKPPTLSKALAMTIHEAEAFQTRWFQMHPGIKVWHEEVENSLMTTRSVRNKFGFRRFYFDRIQGLLPQALAWIPQSTIAIVINKGLVAISETYSSIELLMQVHDSLVGQFPRADQYLNLPILRRCLSVTIPYPDPLIIGTSLDISEKSWGDLISLDWKDVE